MSMKHFVFNSYLFNSIYQTPFAGLSLGLVSVKKRKKNMVKLMGFLKLIQKMCQGIKLENRSLDISVCT